MMPPDPRYTPLWEFSREPRVDTRDLYARLRYLEGEVEYDEDDNEVSLLEEDEQEEMRQLQEIEKEVDGYSGSDFNDGVTLIAEEDFEDYAREFADDVGAYASGSHWPPVDWKQAAEELQMDYTSVEICNRTYWFR